MICPVCGSDVDPSRLIQNVATCPNCHRSVALENGTLRLARSSDTLALTDADVKALRVQRGRTR